MSLASVASVVSTTLNAGASTAINCKFCTAARTIGVFVVYFIIGFSVYYLITKAIR